MAHERRHFLAGEAGLLARIRDPAMDLAIWRRIPPLSVRRFASVTPFDKLPNATFECDVNEVANVLRKAIPDDPLDGWDFANDVEYLGRIFAAVAITRRLRVRVEAIDHDGCRKFHVDRVKTRLVCTYRGPASEWLPEHAVDRAALGSDNPSIVRSWNALRRAPRYAVLINKGELIAGPNGGIVHRSPPAKRPEDARLVVVIDDAATAYR